jgi:hypothetical protein
MHSVSPNRLIRRTGERQERPVLVLDNWQTGPQQALVRLRRRRVDRRAEPDTQVADAVAVRGGHARAGRLGGTARRDSARRAPALLGRGSHRVHVGANSKWQWVSTEIQLDKLNLRYTVPPIEALRVNDPMDVLAGHYTHIEIARHFALGKVCCVFNCSERDLLALIEEEQEALGLEMRAVKKCYEAQLKEQRAELRAAQRQSTTIGSACGLVERMFLGHDSEPRLGDDRHDVARDAERDGVEGRGEDDGRGVRAERSAYFLYPELG